MLPSMFGMLKSDTHRDLSNRRRDEHILAWLARITTVRRVDMRGAAAPSARRSVRTPPVRPDTAPRYGEPPGL